MKAPLFFPVFVSALFFCVSCDRDLSRHDGFRPGEDANDAALPPSPDAGTGDVEGVEKGSGSRTDYKPTTGPGGIEEEEKE